MPYKWNVSSVTLATNENDFILYFQVIATVSVCNFQNYVWSKTNDLIQTPFSKALGFYLVITNS